MKQIKTTLENAKGGDVLAIICTILIGYGIVSTVHGLSGQCRVPKFDLNDAADYGCSTGLFIRGLGEQIPVADSVKNQP